MTWNAWMLINFQQRLYTTTVTSSLSLSIYPSSSSLYRNILSLLNFLWFLAFSQKMEFLRSSFLSLSIFMAVLCSSQGYVFHVGGKQGWSVNPSEDYNQWAGRNRFQINDTLGKSHYLRPRFGFSVFWILFSGS